METALEEETYEKMIYIVIGILVVVVTIVIMDLMTGGTLFKNLVCAIVWYLPLSGNVGASYVGCGGIPL
ncbi:MAG: hypothetical protein V1678_03100 [Candidatus Aenigmatarchaeota archaeon]